MYGATRWLATLLACLLSASSLAADGTRYSIMDGGAQRTLRDLPADATPAGLVDALRELARPDVGEATLAANGIRAIGGVDLIRLGDRRSVEMFAIALPGAAPVVAWVTARPDRRLFAYLEPDGTRIVEQGWERVVDSLLARQARAIRSDQAKLVRELAHPLEGRLLISNVRPWNTGTGTLDPPSDVLLEDGRIVDVTPQGVLRNRPRGLDWAVDAEGRSLVPGFEGAVEAGGWSELLALAAGTGADHVLVDGDSVTLVIVDGKAYYPAEIQRTLGFPPTTPATVVVKADEPPPPRRSLESDRQPLIFQ